jgi:sulfite exporter TauE/SafE
MIGYTGFLLGFLGSFHCVGMCGPIALAVPVRAGGWTGRIGGALLYNLGRTMAYATIGAALGALGMSVAFIGYQQVLSIALGSLMLFGLLMPPDWLQGRRTAWLTAGIRNSLGRLLQDPTPGKQLGIGFLNGLLPCGLVYMGLAGALATAHLLDGSLFMAAFGLGTVPAMMATIVLGNWSSLGLRNRIRRWSPYLVGAMAVLLILRGLNLGIPYLSPQIENMTKVSSTGDRCH